MSIDHRASSKLLHSILKRVCDVTRIYNEHLYLWLPMNTYNASSHILYGPL